MNLEEIEVLYNKSNEEDSVSIEDINTMVNSIPSIIEEVKRLREEVETLRMQLAGCGVAAMANTAESIAIHRIGKDNLYWSSSYGYVCDAVDREIALREENERLRKGIKAVDDLISNSQGVYGLHLNGDLAPWVDLLPGGYFEQWLNDFAEAIKDDRE